MIDVDTIIANLHKEIEDTQDGTEKIESMSRLKAAAEVYSGNDRIIRSTEVVEELKNQKEEFKILSTWDKLDSILGGFYPQQLITVSAATKSGKTSFMMDLTSKIQEHNPLWFPFEESAKELLQKYIDRNEEPPLFCTPKSIGGITMEWVESKIVESIVKFNSKVIIVDHLDYVIAFSNDNHALRLGQAMRDLKSLAKKWDVVIFLICHLVKTRMDTQPTLEDLRGGSAIAQESDTVILLWREMKKINGQVEISNNLNVSIQANRKKGKTGNIKMIYDNGKFYEKDWVSLKGDFEDDNEKF